MGPVICLCERRRSWYMKARVSGVPTAQWLGIKYQLVAGLDECPGSLRYSWFEHPQLDHPHMIPGEWRWSCVRCLLGKPGSCTCMHLSRSLLLPATTLHSAANASIWGVSSHTHSMTLLYLSQLPVPLSSLRWPQAKAHGSLLYLQTQQRDTMNYSCYDNSRTKPLYGKRIQSSPFHVSS